MDVIMTWIQKEMESYEKKIKKCGFVLIVCLVSVIIVGVYFINQNWTIRYASVFDGFFGKNSGECIDEEKKDSLIYDEYEINNIYPELSENVPGKFHNWYILYDDGQNESIWHITDHVYKMQTTIKRIALSIITALSLLGRN